MESATRVLFNGTILTMDAFNTVVPAIAFKGERILATGGNDEMLSLAGPGAERTDLNGATVIPGFYDAHGHFFMNVEFPSMTSRNGDVIHKKETRYMPIFMKRLWEHSHCMESARRR